jgi:glycosyltransferase involved in cell wall biosynthesis
MALQRKLLTQGWRFFPSSYCVVNTFWCLELLRRPDVRLWHQDVPYRPGVPQTRGMLPPALEEQMAAIPAPGSDDRPDVVLRIRTPYDFTPAGDSRVFVFGTAEYGCVARSTAGGRPLREALAGSSARIVTCSEWSRTGFIRSGADPAIVSVVPLGIEPSLFQPLAEAQRQALRQKCGWNAFTYLHIGHMAANKGLQFLLLAFAQVAAKHPDVMLVLKGLDLPYHSRDQLREVKLSPADEALVRNRVRYFGQTTSFAEMAQLYQMADAYVSPYHAEGFNLPVLEAMACGAPVICTAGGPTDEFTYPECALRIPSTRQEQDVDGETRVCLVPDLSHLVAHMLAVKENPEIAARARIAGPARVRERHTWKHTVDRLLEVLFPG